MIKYVLSAAAVAALLSVGCSSSSTTTATVAATDAGKDTGVKTDGATTPGTDGGAPRVDAGGTPTATCEPPDTTPTFSTPAALPPTATWAQGKCTAATVAGFLEACLTGAAATKATCDSWKAANANCSSCLVTPKNAAAIGPFVTDPAITADDSNPPGLVNDGFLSSLQGCMSHFKAGCGESYFGFANCLDAACNDKTNCKNASKADLDTCQTDAIGQGQGVCGTVANAALGTSGKCKGVFNTDAGIDGGSCFSKGVAGGEDTTTDAGLVAFFTRIGMMYCGN